MSKYKLGICEIHNPFIHGNNSSDYHFIVYCLFTPEQLYNNEYKSYTNFLRKAYRHFPNYCFDHIIKTYKKIVLSKKSFQIDIIQYDVLPNGEYNACIKTHYIRLIQRKWKNIYYSRKKYGNPKMLLYREIYGNWPK